MRYRKLCGLLLLLALITGFFAGCQLAKEESGENGEDRMIGVLITTAYLEPFDFVETGDGNDFVQECGEQMVGESAQEGRLYAALWTKTLTDEETGKAFTTREYVFEEVDGIAYFAANVPATEEEEGFLGTSTDDAISEGRFDVFEGDEEQRITLEGTIYLSADMGAGRTYYINPVFQSEEGSVYATAGDGIMVDGVQTEGNAWSQTMDSTVTLTENGESKKQAFSISLSLSVMDCPEEIVLLQMDEQSNVIKRQSYAPGKMPERLSVDTRTAYLIVETHKVDAGRKAVVAREILDRTQETAATFYCREDGICVKQYTQIVWGPHKL